VVHGRRFVAVDLVECIDMADNKRQERAAEMKEQEMSAEMRKELAQQLLDEEQDKNMEEAERKFREWQKKGSPLIEREKDTPTFSEGGAVNKSRGTGAAETGTGFQGVF
jgi:predicted Holliday junction resolvase-like endonuclease